MVESRIYVLSRIKVSDLLNEKFTNLVNFASYTLHHLKCFNHLQEKNLMVSGLTRIPKFGQKHPGNRFVGRKSIIDKKYYEYIAAVPRINHITYNNNAINPAIFSSFPQNAISSTKG